MGPRNRSFTLSVAQPTSAGKVLSKLSVPTPEPSSATTCRSTTKQPPDLCRKRRRYHWRWL
jgi:hypothetical protein